MSEEKRISTRETTHLSPPQWSFLEKHFYSRIPFAASVPSNSKNTLSSSASVFPVSSPTRGPQRTLSSSAPELPRKIIRSDILALNPDLRFEDGSIPVIYQLDNQFILRLMKNKEEDLAPPQPYRGLTLRKIGNNQWEIYDCLTKTSTKPIPNFSYAFVTMPDESIRVTASTDTIHLKISDSSPALRYAGNVKFNDRGEIAFWNNASGNFQPSANLKHQSGFYEADMDKFNDYYHAYPQTPAMS